MKNSVHFSYLFLITIHLFKKKCAEHSSVFYGHGHLQRKNAPLSLIMSILLNIVLHVCCEVVEINFKTFLVHELEDV